MSKKETYKTVKEKAQSLLVEKKSKFISSVCPVKSEEEALAFLGEIRSKYPDATHNVYAYVIDENNIFRYSDDGEPGGTAGMPVLDAMRKRDIVDAAIVVTRYFGGTLLGTGGLVHAYSESAKQGLDAAKVIERRLCDILSFRVDYSLLGKIQYEIASRGYILEDTLYEDNVTFIISAPVRESDSIIKALTDMTNGKCEIVKTDKKYIDMELIEQ